MTTIVNDWFHFKAPGGEIRAFGVKPNSPPPWPALIIIHGVNGLGPHMEAKARDFAAEGYFAVAPDIYTHDPGFKTHDPDDILAAAHMGADRERQEEALAHYSEAKRADVVRARAWMDNRRGSTYIAIIRGCYDALKARQDVAAIGCIGYCMGGRLTGELAATGADLAAGVICYGGHPKLELVPNIKCPLQGHYAVTDKGITGKVPDFAAALKAAGKEFTYYIYEADHGFSLQPGTESYNHEATLLSAERIKPFLAEHLKAAVHAGAAN